jgi:hypothetical protein
MLTFDANKLFLFKFKVQGNTNQKKKLNRFLENLMLSWIFNVNCHPNTADSFVHKLAERR